jgi:hypothetical protein
VSNPPPFIDCQCNSGPLDLCFDKPLDPQLPPPPPPIDTSEPVPVSACIRCNAFQANCLVTGYPYVNGTKDFIFQNKWCVWEWESQTPNIRITVSVDQFTQTFQVTLVDQTMNVQSVFTNISLACIGGEGDTVGTITGTATGYLVNSPGSPFTIHFN